MINHTSTTAVMATLVAIAVLSPRQLCAAEAPIKVGDTIVVLQDTQPPRQAAHWAQLARTLEISIRPETMESLEQALSTSR